MMRYLRELVSEKSWGRLSQIVFAILLFFIFGCAHTHRLPQNSSRDDFNEINKKLSDEEVTIVLAESAGEIETKNISITSDSISYLDIEQEKRKRVATAEVNKIVQTKYGRGAAEGFGLGLLAGSAIFGSSVLIALSTGDNSEAAAFHRLGIVATGLAVGGAAVVISPLIGAAKGSQDIYILNPASSSHNANR